ncbi:MAG TPA: CopG family antitoxin [Candidatus Paceibacterota bacterium]|nr:CopG family antitoxin [Candidatus Paceibacterota bacterium]HMO82802.1 CopG family antitoxin [Candidatus Paceibacterota bacterium]
MKNNNLVQKLTPEEQAMHDSIDWSTAHQLTDTEKKRLSQIAKNTLTKNRVITLRVTEKNLAKIKAAAAREGLPYQTFITSLLHKHVS